VVRTPEERTKQTLRISAVAFVGLDDHIIYGLLRQNITHFFQEHPEGGTR
jgi:hypothetical protein